MGEEQHPELLMKRLARECPRTWYLSVTTTMGEEGKRVLVTLPDT